MEFFKFFSENNRPYSALILCPTRELAQQVQKVILALGDYMNVQAHVCIGGTNVGEDIRKLDFGQHVVVGTPGRTFDMIRRRNLRTRNIKVCRSVLRNLPKSEFSAFDS